MNEWKHVDRFSLMNVWSDKEQKPPTVRNITFITKVLSKDHSENYIFSFILKIFNLADSTEVWRTSRLKLKHSELAFLIMTDWKGKNQLVIPKVRTARVSTSSQKLLVKSKYSQQQKSTFFVWKEEKQTKDKWLVKKFLLHGLRTDGL